MFAPELRKQGLLSAATLTGSGGVCRCCLQVLSSGAVFRCCPMTVSEVKGAKSFSPSQVHLPADPLRTGFRISLTVHLLEILASLLESSFCFI